MTPRPLSAQRLAEVRDLVARRGRIEIEPGDYAVDSSWHIASELLDHLDYAMGRVLDLVQVMNAIGRYVSGEPGLHPDVLPSAERAIRRVRETLYLKLADPVNEEPPSKLGWHAISGESLLAMLRRVQAGEDPDLVYLEEYANAEHEQVEGE